MCIFVSSFLPVFPHSSSLALNRKTHCLRGRISEGRKDRVLTAFVFTLSICKAYWTEVIERVEFPIQAVILIINKQNYKPGE